MIATDASVGLKNCTVADYYVIVLPVTAYIATAVATIWIEQKYHRAAPGGTGYAKCGGNYAASLYPKHLAYEKKCNEVLYLDAKTNSFIEEFSGMSFFMVKKNCLYTPKISDTILDSITRKSIIQIAKDLKIKVFQTDIKLNNFLADVKSKRVTEVFACGTAAVVTPVGFFKSTKFKNLIVNNGKEGPITAQLKKQLLQIQKGIIADKYK
jgi:branched-chain amino acid aminotransferase